MEHVEEQRLQQRGIGAHRLEIEYLQALHGQGVVEVVEEARVPATLDPFAGAAGQGAREQIGHGEKTTLAPIEYVCVLNGFVDLAIFEIAQAIAVTSLEQHPNERMQEVKMLRCRVERERIDADVRIAEADLQIAASQQGREFPIAVAEIEDDRERVVLLRMGRQKIHEEALAAARGT